MADSAINYDDAIKYWSSVTRDEDGVLGGFGATEVPTVDVAGSLKFVERLGQLSSRTFPTYVESEKLALDVGAGIGRVTRDVLCQFCDKVDILEPAEPLISRAKQVLGPLDIVNNYYAVGIQDFTFPSQPYWVVWCQWCLGQVPDEVLIQFLRNCSKHLQAGGLIVVKENICRDEDLFDETDSSVTRTHEKFKQIFTEARLRILLTSVQRGMPKELFPIRLYALAPVEANN